MTSIKELDAFNIAFLNFLRKLNFKDKIVIRYYSLPHKSRMLDVSFLGYKTSKEGFHGIHYLKVYRSFRFGTQSLKGDSFIMTLNARQEEKVHECFKKYFFEVAEAKKSITIRKIKKEDSKGYEWK